MEFLQLVVIFAAFLNLGSGRVITSEQESILRYIDELEELTLNLETKNEESAAQIEGSIEETGSASRVIPQNSNHDASGESADELEVYVAVNVTAPPEVTARRVRRNPTAEPSCLHSFFQHTLPSGTIILHPLCYATATDQMACMSSLQNGHSGRLCELSHFVKKERWLVPTNCACAS